MVAGRSVREDGETLIEILISVTILGLAVVSILSGLAAMVTGTDIHRKQSAGMAVLLSAAEVLTDSGTAYVRCASTSSYASAVADTTRVARPAGWSAPQITLIKYWNGSSFGSTCTDSALSPLLTPLQLVTLTVSSPDGRDTETLDVVKRSST